jgi:hypothetical protein
MGGRGEQPLDEALVGVGTIVVEERAHLFRGRRQAAQVEGETPQEGGPICLERWR